MNQTASDVFKSPESHPSHLPDSVVSLLLGAVLVVAVLIAAILPAVVAVYLVVGFAVQDVVVVLVLWMASATATIVSFIAISQAYAWFVSRGRPVVRSPTATSAED